MLNFTYFCCSLIVEHVFFSPTTQIGAFPTHAETALGAFGKEEVSHANVPETGQEDIALFQDMAKRTMTKMCTKNYKPSFRFHS